MGRIKFIVEIEIDYSTLYSIADDCDDVESLEEDIESFAENNFSDICSQCNRMEIIDTIEN